jgi:dipeptidyl aminopeptidase/acylaminoacyl peptidase
MKKRPLSARDLWSIPRVGHACPAPDGRRFVVPVTTYEMKRNEGATRLWLEPEHRAVTAAGTDSSQPAISPDGTRLAFLRKQGDQLQLHVVTLDGGEPERITDLPLGAADPQWFPDGRRIALLVPLLAEAPTVEGTRALAKKRADDPVKARVTEDRVYRYWDRWLTDGKFPHLFVIDLRTRTLIDLTPRMRRWFDFMEPTGQYRISPDGEEIAFGACRSRPPHHSLRWGVFRVSVARRKVVEFTMPGASDALRPVYSPDGRSIVYGIRRDPEFYADRVRLVRYDRRRRTHEVLTESWDRSAAEWEFGPGGLLVLAEDEGRSGLFRLSRAGPRRLARGGTYSGLRVAGGRVFATVDSLRRPPEICRLLPERRLTNFSAPALRGTALGRVEEDVFSGAEGERVRMFRVHPPGHTGRPRPLVHLVHGGPHGIFGDSWHWRWNPHCFAAPGYVAALVNFQGSTSWGQDFARRIQGRWGDRPFRDVMAATDRLIERGIADPKRLAAAGGSYGGYLVSWMASQTARFSCIVNHAGVGDLQMEWASDVTQGWSRALGGEPWGNLAGMDRWNPMRHAKGFRTPMLVIHGEQDYRVPYDQGLQMYNVHKAMGRPARLVCYPDENHWILKPRNSVHWYGEVLAWLRRWL